MSRPGTLSLRHSLRLMGPPVISPGSPTTLRSGSLAEQTKTRTDQAPGHPPQAGPPAPKGAAGLSQPSRKLKASSEGARGPRGAYVYFINS